MPLAKTNQWLRRPRALVPMGGYGSPRHPVAEAWGLERGTPVDRYYIERFLAQHRADIRGRVVEIKDSGYTDRFGGAVTQRDVRDVDPNNQRATMVADLAAAQAVPDDTFDCFILTQTLSYRMLLPEHFGPERVDVHWHGNVGTAIALLLGLTHEELRLRQLDLDDPYHPLIITVRAVKAPSRAA